MSGTFSWNPLSDFSEIQHKMAEFAQWAQAHVVDPLMESTFGASWADRDELFVSTELRIYGLSIRAISHTIIEVPVGAKIESRTDIMVPWYNLGLDRATLFTLTSFMNKIVPLVDFARNGGDFSPHASMDTRISLSVFYSLVTDTNDKWYEYSVNSYKSDMAELWDQYDQLVHEWEQKRVKAEIELNEVVSRKIEAESLTGYIPQGPGGPGGNSPDFLTSV